MLDIRKDIPVKEDAIDRINQTYGQIVDLLNECREIMGVAAKGRVLLKREEVANILRCEPKSIPRVIPNIRVGRNWLYEEKDVYDFIESRKKKRY